MFAQIRDLTGLRIEEGTRRDIPHTGDPLDGTWTGPAPELRSMLLVQQFGALALMAVVWLPMMFVLLLTADGGFWRIMMIPMVSMLAAFALLAVIPLWTSNRFCKRHRFRLTDEELVIESGIISVSRVLIPLVQIQQVNVHETWLSRRYGLKGIMVNTAGLSYTPNAGLYGGSMILGQRNADDVAEAILSRVKAAKSLSRGP